MASTFPRASRRQRLFNLEIAPERIDRAALPQRRLASRRFAVVRKQPTAFNTRGDPLAVWILLHVALVGC